MKRLISTAILVAPWCGCHDQVVGGFSSGGTSGIAEATSSSGATSTGAQDLTGSEASTSGEEDGPFVGCFADEFDDGSVDPMLWNTFADDGTSVDEAGGTLRLTPASMGLAYSGVTTGYAYRFGFAQAWVRLHLETEVDADRPLSIYMQVSEGTLDYNLRLRSGTLEVLAPDAEGVVTPVSYPAFASVSGLGIRGENGQVVFEATMDGLSWDTVATVPLSEPFERTKILAMVETAGDNPDQSPIAIERIEACAE